MLQLCPCAHGNVYNYALVLTGNVYIAVPFPAVMLEFAIVVKKETLAADLLLDYLF